jgi:hypothetical protein
MHAHTSPCSEEVLKDLTARVRSHQSYFRLKAKVAAERAADFELQAKRKLEGKEAVKVKFMQEQAQQREAAGAMSTSPGDINFDPSNFSPELIKLLMASLQAGSEMTG